MTPTTNKMKSSAAIIAERDAGHTRITSIATSLQADALDRKTRWQAYQRNPLSLDRAAAMELFHELQALEPMAAAFHPEMLNFQLRAFDERFFAEEKGVCVPVFNAELTAVLERQPGFVERVKVGLVATITKAWDKATGREDRDKLLEERDAQEAKLEVLETNIGYARAAIARFASIPTALHFGECQSAIGFVKSSLA